ncbi:MAG: cistern family PEP-CTERM protein, partial [Acidobacteria bacterium]|nr:cistern family PEP-CTERM protein [Acidobacteriota bacterium]
AVIISVAPFVTDARADAISLNAGMTYQFDVLWSMLVSKGGRSTTLEALGEFNVTVFDTSADFLITLTNDTELVSERVHSIGFDTFPDATSLSNPLPGSVFQNFALYQNFPLFRTIDICAWTSSNCSGGARESNLPGGGAADSFGFTLWGDFSNGMELSNFVIKFQGELGSYQFNGTPTPPITVPEYDSSASLLLVGMAFVAAFGAGARR